MILQRFSKPDETGKEPAGGSALYLEEMTQRLAKLRALTNEKAKQLDTRPSSEGNS